MAKSLCVLVAALLVAGTSAALLRRSVVPQASSLPGDPKVHREYAYPPRQNPETTAKFTNAEAVEQTLFVMACKAKHKNDVDGMARDVAKEKGFSEDEFMSYTKNLQKTNIVQMKETCGTLNAKATKSCHEGCTEKWAQGGSFSLVKEKEDCTASCILKHKNWGEECVTQVENLQSVYVQEQGNLANTKKCQDLHCPLFPAVLAAKDDDAAEEVKKEGCKNECSNKKIKARCVKRWDLNVDFSVAGWQNECVEETKAAKLDPCMGEGTSKVDGEETECKDKGHGNCDEEHQACMDEGAKAGEDSMVGAHAESICGTRKANCYAQADAGCVTTHKKALEKLSKKCVAEHKAETHKCLDKRLKEGKEKYAKECEAEIKPTCKEGCDKNCQIPNVRSCQKDMLKKAFAVTQEYCSQLWDWLFNSEQLDPKTMDVIPKATGGGRSKLVAARRLQAKPE